MFDWKKHIKSNMEAREIQPSASAWERLDKQMDAQQPKQRKPYFLWIGIAASLLILFSVGYFFLNHKTLNDTPIVTEQNSDKQIINENTAEEFVPKNENTEYNTTSEPKAIAKKPSNSTQEKGVAPKKKVDTPVVEPSSRVEETIFVENEKPLPIEPKKEVESYEKISSDELLANAWEKRKLFKTQKIAINSEKMLNQIEDEIYEEKSPDILERLTNQIKNIQVALAERNETE